MVLRIKEREEAIQLITMDTKVCGKLLTLHQRGNGVNVEALHDQIPLRQDAGKGPQMGSHGYRRLQRWKSGFVAPLTDFLRLYISIQPENIQEHHETLFPPPHPSVPVRSHLGAISDAPSEGESITDGFYINTIASPMKCEQFTTDLRVHSYQLDGFFSLFGSQYKVLIDSLGDLFDVTLFCGVFVEIR